MYSDLRFSLFEYAALNTDNFMVLSDVEKFHVIMSTGNLQYVLAKTVFKMYMRRCAFV